MPAVAAPELTGLCHLSLVVEPARAAGTDQVEPESIHAEEADPMSGSAVRLPIAMKLTAPNPFSI